MSNGEARLLLWVFHAINKDGNGVFSHCYARTEIEARQKEGPWMAQMVNAGFGDIKVEHYPNGFNQHLPGSIDESEASHADRE